MLSSLRYFFGSDEGSNIVCARRDPSSYLSSAPHSQAQRHSGTSSIPQTATEFLLANQITVIDIGPEEQAFSSSQVRTGRLRSSREREGGAGKRWKDVVSERVAWYIEENEMYLE
jgi:nicotinamide-nucleotide adenylyltransferase